MSTPANTLNNAASSFDEALPENTQILWYRVIHLTSKGEYSHHYLCEDLERNCHVMIQEYFPTDLVLREPGTTRVIPNNPVKARIFQVGLQQFVQTTEKWLGFRHPNVQGVIELFETNNTVYVVMEYEVGQTLAEKYQQNKTFQEIDILILLFQLLDGLDQLHYRRLFHGHISMSQILFRNNTEPTLLVDLARDAGKNIGQTLGVTTDIYDLAKVLYQLTTTEEYLSATDNREHTTTISLPAHQRIAGKYSMRLLLAIDKGLKIVGLPQPENVTEWKRCFEFHEENRAVTLEELLLKIDHTDLPGPEKTQPILIPYEVGKITFLESRLANPAIDSAQRPTIPEAEIQHNQKLNDTGPSASRTSVDVVSSDEIIDEDFASQNHWLRTSILLLLVLCLYFIPKDFIDSRWAEHANRILPTYFQLPTQNSPSLSRVEIKKPDRESQQAANKITSTPKLKPEQTATEKEVDRLLSEAERDFQAQRLILPLGKNALSKYQHVLELSPNNSQAINGIDKIEGQYLDLINRHMELKQYTEAKTLLDRVAPIFSSSSQMATLRQTLNLKVATGKSD